MCMSVYQTGCPQGAEVVMILFPFLRVYNFRHAVKDREHRTSFLWRCQMAEWIVCCPAVTEAAAHPTRVCGSGYGHLLVLFLISFFIFYTALICVCYCI